MSDNDDLLADDIGDHSLADYTLGNEEEEQLLADDYDGGASQNVPPSVGHNFGDANQMVGNEYSDVSMDYGTQQQEAYTADTECVVPHITVEVPNVPIAPVPHTRPDPLPTYAPYEPPPYEEHAVPPAIPAAPVELPQTVPSEVITSPIANGELGSGRERFISERPPGAQRTPQIRDIPDSLDKVVVPRGGGTGGAGGGFNMRARTSWRNPQFSARFAHHQQHPYRRNNVHRGNFQQRPSFPAPNRVPEPNHSMPPQERPNLPQQMPPNLPQEMHQNHPMQVQVPQHRFRPDRPIANRPMFNPNMNHFPGQNFNNTNMRPPFQQFRPQYRPFQPQHQPGPNMGPNIPQITIRQQLPSVMTGQMDRPKMGREPEVRMLPVQLPTNLPPGGLQGKKVLINPHFKGNFQPPVEGLTYIPTRIQKSPPLSPTLENKFGPIKDIDDAAERFIAEQRDALARAAAGRKPAGRRSPQRFIENTTIEIENEFARGGGGGGGAAPPRGGGPGGPPSLSADEEDLLRRQEEFISANRAGLRRRMRSPSPPRRSASPRRSLSPPRRRASPPPPPPARYGPLDEESEYARRVREQENLRERVLRAKEVRRRRHASTLQRQLLDRERERQEKERLERESIKPVPDTTTVERDRHTEQPLALERDRRSPRKSPERDRSPPRAPDTSADTLTPPRDNIPKVIKVEEKPLKPVEKVDPSPERDLTPPLPAPVPADAARMDSDDELDLILDDIDGILSDDDDSGRFKERAKKSEPAPKVKSSSDLRAKLPPRAGNTEAKLPPRAGNTETKRGGKQRITFDEVRDKRKRDKTPPKKVTNEHVAKKLAKKNQETENVSLKSRQRIIFDSKDKESEKTEKSTEEPNKKSTGPFANRRVVLQRKVSSTLKKTEKTDKSVFSRIEVKQDPTKPNPGIFSRAVRTAIGNDKPRIVLKRTDEPEVEVASDDDDDYGDEEQLLNEEAGNTALVTNLPHGITDTRLKTLAGADVQSLSVDKEERSAKITFKTTLAAETFKRKFNSKMVAASRLTVTLR